MVRVLPDEPGLDKTFDYLVPEALGDQVRVGHGRAHRPAGRRVGGWVVADDVEPPDGVDLQPLAKVTGWGPPAELLDLADWAAWRWAGRPASVPAHGHRDPRGAGAAPATAAHASRRRAPVAPDEVHDLAAEALAGRRGHGPAAAGRRSVPGAGRGRRPRPDPGRRPGVAARRRLGLRLRRAGLPVAIMPDDWAPARAGAASVVGTRAAAWAPVAGPAAVVVLDEHDESLQQEQAPTWHARDVAVERARRAGVPCVLVSPRPSLEALALGPAAGPVAGGRAGRLAGGRRGRPPRRRRRAQRAVLRAARAAPCAAAGGWCACSTARAGPACWPAPPAARSATLRALRGRRGARPTRAAVAAAGAAPSGPRSASPAAPPR